MQRVLVYHILLDIMQSYLWFIKERRWRILAIRMPSHWWKQKKGIRWIGQRLYTRVCHYYILGLFCDPNIIANNKERCFWNLVVANHNSSQILKLLRYHNIRTRTIASPSQLPNLIQSQNFFDYNCFYPLFAINTTSETICNKPITVTI